MTDPIILESSLWIEVLKDSENGQRCKPFVDEPTSLIIPAITLTEVYRFVLRELGPTRAQQVAAMMMRSPIIPVNDTLALRAASLGHAHQIALADSLILATSELHNAAVYTQDADFDGLPRVCYFPKPTL